MNDQTAIAVPDGFEILPPFGPFHELIGPLYIKWTDGRCAVGVRVEEKHRNRFQAMHGGMICTLIDTATAWASKCSRTPAIRVVTTNLTINLMGNAAPGEWVEARVEVLRSGRSLVFSDCHVWCDGRVIAQASAQFLPIGEDTGEVQA
jgi:uncharacterized protein (TIGR00369 family)